MSSTYIDYIQYQRMPNGVALGGYLGNSMRLSGSVVAGATTLSVTPATTVDLHQYDQIYIFDGLNSEIVTVNTDTNFPATSITLQSGTVYAHAANIPLCSDGTQGSLGMQLFAAGQWIEDICRQSLYVSTYSNEILSMPTMRASIDEQQTLWLRPRHFPITGFSAISIAIGNVTAISYDPTQAIIDSDRQVVQIPALVPLPSSGSQPPYSLYPMPISRATKATVTITYNSGWPNLPPTIQRACALLTNQCFVELANAVGADQIVQGKRNVIFTLRGDPSGESLLVKQARKLLQPYVVEES